MSRIGKKPIIIPKGVEIKIDGSFITVKGPKGELKREFLPAVSFEIVEDKIFVKPNDIKEKPLWGLCRALLNIMIKGVSDGFEKTLEFTGVGFRAQVNGNRLELKLGYTNPVVIEAPAGVSFSTEKSTIKVMGIDKEKVGQTAALVRGARLPEPYKGTGIKYQDEIIIRKAGKKAVAGA